MERVVLQYVLKMVAQDFDERANPEQITQFKQRYAGVPWQKTIEKDLLKYANTAVAMKRWISNIVLFMEENGIERD